MSDFHFAPAYKAVEVVCEKDGKADNDRYVGYVLECRQRPENDQYDIVKSVGKGEIRASAHSKICRQKACGDRQSTRKKISRSKKFKYEVKDNGHNGGHAEHYEYLPFAYAIDLYLRALSLIRISQPRNKRKYRHRKAHKNVGHKLAVIGKAQRYYTVEYAKYDHKDLTYRVALGAEYESGDPHKRGDKRKNITSVEKQKGYYDNGYRDRPEDQLAHRKIFQKLFHFTSKKICIRPRIF